MNPTFTNIGRSSALALALCTLEMGIGQAATSHWVGNGGDNNWTTTANWDSLPVAGDDLVFVNNQSQLNNVNDFPAGTQFNSLDFTGLSGGYTISGNALSTSTIFISDASSNNSLNFGWILNGATSKVDFSSSSQPNNLTLGGNISGAGASLLLKGLTGSGGVINLNGANSYTGGTTLDLMHVNVGHDSAFGTGTVVVDQYSSINLNGHTLANNADLYANCGGISGADIGGDGTWSGTITLHGNACLGSTGGNLLISGVIQGTVGGILYAPKHGTLTLTNTNTYNLTQTNVSNGTLLVNGSINGPVYVDTQGILGGSGSIIGDLSVANGGTLAPGQSPAILNTGNLTLLSGSSLGIEINAPAPGTGHDQVRVTGSLSLAGTLSVTLGYTPLNGANFIIIDNDGNDAVSGTFAGLAEGQSFSVNGVTFSISYSAGTGNDVGFTVVSGGAVPVATPSPTGISFGSQLFGTSSNNHSLVITNSGNGPLTIPSSPASLTGTNISDFNILTNNCDAVTLNPSESCNLEVNFTPKAVGSRNAGLRLISSDPNSPLTVSLSGRGIVPGNPTGNVAPIPTLSAWGTLLTSLLLGGLGLGMRWSRTRQSDQRRASAL